MVDFPSLYYEKLWWWRLYKNIDLQADSVFPSEADAPANGAVAA